MPCNVGNNCYQNTRKKFTEVQHCQEARKLNPRLIVVEPDTTVKMFKQVLTKLVDEKWSTAEQTDGILIQYKKYMSEMKQFHYEKFAGFQVWGGKIGCFLL